MMWSSSSNDASVRPRRIRITTCILLFSLLIINTAASTSSSPSFLSSSGLNQGNKGHDGDLELIKQKGLGGPDHEEEIAEATAAEQTEEEAQEEEGPLRKFVPSINHSGE